ncbi:hypothetical protein VTN00DRAFT_9993 [Thermoascus crustaceus]|uniref:uncharacterized protein n=1 Tax=Thermoascus crustaceus TaxID=5088 RepID=UPI0037438DD2
MELKNLSSNWKKLQEKLKKEKASASTTSGKRKISDRETQNGVKRRKTDTVNDKNSGRQRQSLKRKRMSEGTGDGGAKEVQDTVTEVTSRRNSTTSIAKAEPRTGKINEGLSPTAEIGKYVAIDCEMVGVGPDPDNDSALARVSIVNYNGDQVYDSFVKPKEKVTDWRTHVSGITPKHMLDARTLEEVQKDVAQILEGTILIGHAVQNDLDALLLSHPKRDIRDTSKYPPYRKIAGGGSPRLKVLAEALLGLKIQEGAHSSVEDARATMLLFRRDKEGIEREHAKKWPVRVVTDNNGENKTKKKKKTKKKSRKR